MVQGEGGSKKTRPGEEEEKEVANESRKNRAAKNQGGGGKDLEDASSHAKFRSGGRRDNDS